MTFDLLSNLLALLALILINAMVIWGLHGGAENTGFIDLFKKLPDWIFKPLIGCPICMPTLWTVPIILLCGFRPTTLPAIYIVLIWLGTAGLNYVIIEFQKKDDE